MLHRAPIVFLTVVLLAAPVLAIGEGVLPRNAESMPVLFDAGAPAAAGAWRAPFEGQIPAIHVALLPDQRVIYWSGDVADEDADNIYFLSTVSPGEVRVMAPPYSAATVGTIPNPAGSDLFCSGHTILPDGRILSAGGSIWHATVAEQETSFVDGTPETRIFDWRTDSWTTGEDMSVARWYPTVMTTAEGGLVASGISRLTDPTSHQPSIETLGDGDEWTTLEGGDNVLPLYPRLTQVPSGPMKGQLYYETGGTLWGPFGEHPQEATWNLAQAYDPETKAWRILGPSVFGVRQSPNNVLLPLDPADGYHARMINFAGTLQRSVVATSTAEITDFATDPPQHAPAAMLNTPRWQSTGILLPDGQVLAVGGALYDNVMTYGSPDPAVMTAELYDPAEDTWTDMAPMTIPREYHGTALLLPDATVLVGGHVPNPVPWTALRDNFEAAQQAPQTKFEIFEPPYLHWNVTQPVLTGAPDHVGYGELFNVATPDAERVVDAMFVRHGAVTHSSDAGQRGILLPVIERTEGRLTFQAPPDAELATPGPWMLFVRVQAEQGLVPGIARSIMLG